MEASQQQTTRRNLISKLDGKTYKAFKSYKKLEKYARRKAVKEGFTFVTGHSKAARYSERNSRVELKCYMHNRGRSEKRRSRSARSGTGCTFRLVASRRKEDQMWSFKALGEYNHPPEHSKDVLAIVEGLSDKAKGHIFELMDQGNNRRDISKLVGHKYPRERIARSSVKDFVHDRQAAPMKGSTRVARLFAYLSTKNCFVRICGNTNRNASRIFFAPHRQAKMLCHYGHVLIMDSTYKTNRYKLRLFHIIGLSPYNTTFQVAFAFLEEENEESYRWALLQLKSIYPRHKSPSVLVTDREQASGNAIKEVFSDANHILCRWHVKRDVGRKMKSLTYSPEAKEKLRADWKACMESETEQEFELKYRLFEETHGQHQEFIQYLKDNWVTRKEQFVTAWVRKIRHFGIITTSRVEGSHSHVKARVLARSKEIGYVVNQIDEYCNLELEKLQETACTDPYAIVKPQEAHLFIALIWDVSNFCMNMMLREYKKINLPRHARLMDLDSDSYDHILNLAQHLSTCECDSKIAYGIPCQHMISLKIARKESIALDDIHEHWKIGCPFNSEEFFLDKRNNITTAKLKQKCIKAFETMDRHSLDVQRVTASSILEILKEPPILHDVAIARKRRGRPTGNYAQESRVQATNEDNVTLYQERTMEREVPKRRRVQVEGPLETRRRRGRPPKRRTAGGLPNGNQRIQPPKNWKRGKRKHCKDCRMAGHNVRTCPQLKQSRGKDRG